MTNQWIRSISNARVVAPDKQRFVLITHGKLAKGISYPTLGKASAMRKAVLLAMKGLKNVTIEGNAKVVMELAWNPVDK